jgi:hypothetical protein
LASWESFCCAKANKMKMKRALENYISEMKEQRKLYLRDECVKGIARLGFRFH